MIQLIKKKRISTERLWYIHLVQVEQDLEQVLIDNNKKETSMNFDFNADFILDSTQYVDGITLIFFFFNLSLEFTCCLMVKRGKTVYIIYN